jgi:hypothetical protein
MNSRRYILFAFDMGDSVCPTDDIRGFFPTFDEAKKEAEKMRFDINKIMDTETGVVTVLEIK